MDTNKGALLKRQFEKSDKSLVDTKKIVNIASIIMALAFSITGIVLFILYFTTSKTSYSSYGHLTTYNGLYLGLGLGLLIGGLLITVLFYKIMQFILWKAYDLKVIRSQIYGMPTSEYIEKFYNTSKYENNTH